MRKWGIQASAVLGDVSLEGAASTVPPKTEGMWGKGFTLWSRGMVCIRQDSPL